MRVTQEIYSSFLRNGVYLWDIDIDNRTIKLGDAMRHLLGLEHEVSTLEELHQRLPDDYRYNFDMIDHEIEEHWFMPLWARDELLWFDAQQLVGFVDDYGNHHYAGVARRMNKQEVEEMIVESGVTVDTIASLVASLAMMTQDDSFYDGIHRVLQNLSNQIKGVRTGVMQWTHDDEFQVIDLVLGAAPMRDRNKEEIGPNSMIYSGMLQRVCEQRSTLMVDDMPSYCKNIWPEEYKFMMRNVGGSAIVAPIVSTSGKVWGVIGVMRPMRTIWTKKDKLWIETVANAVSLCIIRTEQHDKIREQFDMTVMACRAGKINTWYWNIDTGERTNFIYGDDMSMTVIRDNDTAQQIHPFDLRRFNEAHQRVADGESTDLEYRIRCRLTPQDEYNWYEIKGHVALTDNKGRPVSVVGTARNIDEEVRQALSDKRNREFQNAIYNNLPVGIEFFDTGGVLTYANDRMEDIYGLSNKRHIYGINLFDNPTLTPAQFDLIRERDRVEFDVTVDFSKHHEHFHSTRRDTLEVTMRFVKQYKHKRFEGYLGALVDRTTIVVQRRRIAQFDSHISEVGQFAKLGLCWLDGHGNRYISQQWKINLGSPEGRSEDFYGRAEHVIDEDREQLVKQVQQIKNKEIRAASQVVRVIHPDGMLHWIQLHWVFNDNINGITGFSLDVTERKENEQMLIKAREKAERMDLLKSQFLANISHEIRTPLNAIVGFSDLILQCPDDEERQEYARIIRSNNDLLLKLISDILDLSKIESGNMEIVYSMVDITTMCKEIHQSLLIKKPSNVDFLYLPRTQETIMAYCDRSRITQIITNFVNNAFKFTTKGRIMFWFEVEDDTMTFHVSDTGKGIAPEDIERIFESFVKLDMFAVGTGLGLPISRSIARHMGGDVTCESQLGEGSHFILTLPYVRHADNNDTLTTKTPIVVKTIKRAMVLSTDADTLMFISCSLEDFDITRASSVGFFDIWLEKKPQLSIIDVRAATESAADIISCIKQYGAEYKVLAINIAQSTFTDQLLHDSGADEVIRLPISSERFIKIVNDLIKPE